MGIADIDADGILQRAQRDIEMQRVHGAGQRDLAPVEARRAHVDADAALAGGFRIHQPGHRFDDDMVAARFLHQQIGDAAQPVAAGLHHPAIGIANPHEGIGQPVGGRLDGDELVAAHPGAPVGDAPRAILVQREGMLARVDHDEVVAEAVHLQEGRG